MEGSHNASRGGVVWRRGVEHRLFKLRQKPLALVLLLSRTEMIIGAKQLNTVHNYSDWNDDRIWNLVEICNGEFNFLQLQYSTFFAIYYSFHTKRNQSLTFKKRPTFCTRLNWAKIQNYSVSYELRINGCRV